MRVITAPESTFGIWLPSVFLAGGITDCEWWQDEIIEMLESYEGVILNPRRRNFPIHIPSAATEQIMWEYNALNMATVFSMWFCAGKSDQPICMYELGRHLAIRKAKGEMDRVVIGVEKGYRREQDVRIQTELVDALTATCISSNLAEHARNILKAMRITPA
jgi:hypothetical protein